MHIQHCGAVSIVCKCKSCLPPKRKTKTCSPGVAAAGRSTLASGNALRIFGIHPSLKTLQIIKFGKVFQAEEENEAAARGKDGGRLRRGGGCLRQGEYWVSSLALVSSLSHVNTFARSSPGLRCAAAAHRAIGFALRTGAGVTPLLLPEPLQLYNTWKQQTRHRRPAPDNSVTAI